MMIRKNIQYFIVVYQVIGMGYIITLYDFTLNTFLVIEPIVEPLIILHQ